MVSHALEEESVHQCGKTFHRRSTFNVIRYLQDPDFRTVQFAGRYRRIAVFRTTDFTVQNLLNCVAAGKQLRAEDGWTRYWLAGELCGAVRRGDYKLVEFLREDRCELYNLREDPGEMRDLSAAMTDRLDMPRGQLRQWRDSVAATMPS